MNTDGKIVIGTGLDNKQFEKDVQNLEKKLNETEKKNKPTIDLKLSTETFKKNLKNIKDKIKTEFEKINPEIKPEVKEPKEKNIWADYEPPEFTDEISFDEQIEHLKGKIEEIRVMLQKPTNFNLTMEDVEKLGVEEEKLTNQLIQLEKKQQKFNQEINNGKKNTDSLSNSMGGVLKKVAKWTLAIFSVRSAYMFVRQAVSTISQYNEDLANDLEYIRYALASVLEPVIRAIVNLVARLLQYVNYLWKSWFGKDLFKSAKDFESMKNSSSAVAKNTKEIKKNLAGFDEMNILEDTSTTDNNAASNVASPTFDLTSMENFEPPAWLETIKNWGQWIIDHWKLVLGIIAGTGAVFLGIKLAKFLSQAKGVNKEVGGWSSTFKGFFDGLGKAAESIAILGGLTLVIDSITKLIDTFSQSGLTLGEVAGLLGIVLGELTVTFGLLLGAMTLMTPSWQSIAAAAVIFGGFALVINQVTHLLEVFSKSGLELGDVIDLLSGIMLTIIGLMGSIVLLGPAMTAGLVPFLGVVGGISAILLVMAATLPIILEACAKFINDIGPFVIKLIKTINQSINATIEVLGKVLPPIIQSVGNLFTTIFSGVSKVIETIGGMIIGILSSAQQLVVTVLSSILYFINELGPATNNFVDNIITATTKLINFIISGIEYLVNTVVIGGINKIIQGVNALSGIIGISIPLVPELQIPRFVPRLAKGGVISQPGRGVPVGYGQAIAGEGGTSGSREGVIPLTDAQQMALLGESIGKYVNINLTNITKLDNRQIAKEQKRISVQNDFAFNR
ncbi:hypothetical protein [uncultured Rikenella sp.]|uniref:hypothetical protein n=1 Tax=uncultured Rikenella sp. TaxID=368003 RepID=UPI002622D6FA|nr:hypothetical protein [uncultured Rikenella sp.]